MWCLQNVGNSTNSVGHTKLNGGLMKKTNLYVLIFNEFDAIKIGKTDDIASRVNTLKKYWGEPNYSESYVLEVDYDKIFSLEKALHSILKAFSKDFGSGDGKTEMFDKKALEYALAHLQLFIQHSSPSCSLVKGVEPIQSKSSESSSRDYKYIRFKNKGVKLHKGVDQVGKNLKFVTKFVGILQKRRNQIPFQLEKNKEDWILTIKNRHFFNLMDRERFMANFCLNIDDFSSGSLGSNFLLSYSGWKGEIIQMHFGFDKISDNYLLQYYSQQLKLILNSLPSKSQAAIASRTTFE